MQESIKVKKKNEDGIEIIKDIPAELYSNYIALGWTVVKEEKKFASKAIEKPIAKEDLKLDKDND